MILKKDMSKENNFKVGQTLYYVPKYGYDSGVGREITISVVGRKWLKFSHSPLKWFKVNIKTLDAETDTGFCGTCYLSEFHYLDIQQKKATAKSIIELLGVLWHREHKLDKIDLTELQKIENLVSGAVKDE